NKLGKNEFIDKKNESIVENDSDIDKMTGDVATMANLFENAKQSFLQL
ncbi:26944_t:CDS:1, partial [Gigaspora margarita]